MDKRFEKVGLYLKKKRKAAKMSQVELASKLGYSTPQFISNIERGLANLPLDKVDQAAKLFNIKEEKLYALVAGATLQPLQGRRTLVFLNTLEVFFIDKGMLNKLREKNHGEEET